MSDSSKKSIESRALALYEFGYGKKLAIGDIVSIDKDNEYYADWPEQYIVIEMRWDRASDAFNITIAEINDPHDGGSDGWTLDDLVLVLNHA